MNRLTYVLLAVIAAMFLPGAIEGIASTANSFTDVRVQTNAVIASGGTTSAEVDLGGTEIVGLQMPVSFTGVALTFQVATQSGGTYQIMKDGAGNSVSKTVAQGQYISIDPTLFRGARYIELISGSTETAGRTITVLSIPAK